MKSPAERTVDALIVVATSVFATTALCCVHAMWTLRKQFFIALRSPLLGILMGVTFTLRSWVGASYLLTLNNWDPEADYEIDAPSAVFRILFSPASLVSVGAMIAWVVRLLVMYDPIKRRKWGRYTNEKRLFRGLIYMYVLIEVGAWASVGVNGLTWTASTLAILDLASALATVAAAVLLTGKLRKVYDICRLSSDTQRVGALMVGIVFIYAAVFLLPLPPVLFKYTAISLSILPLYVVWVTNVKPVRDYLRQHEHETRGALLRLLFWRRIAGGRRISRGNTPGRVACTTDERKPREKQHGLGSSGIAHLHETPLAAVMEFFPLQQAFGEYCRKALCSESFQFLVAVPEFQSVVLAVHGVGGASSSKDDFDDFMVIVNEYIKDNSNSEINIDSATKKKILGFCERSAYDSLNRDDRESIFLVAEKEIAKMLAENLLNKFKATAQYRALAGEIGYEMDF